MLALSSGFGISPGNLGCDNSQSKSGHAEPRAQGGPRSRFSVAAPPPSAAVAAAASASAAVAASPAGVAPTDDDAVESTGAAASAAAPSAPSRMAWSPGGGVVPGSDAPLSTAASLETLAAPDGAGRSADTAPAVPPLSLHSSCVSSFISVSSFLLSSCFFSLSSAGLSFSPRPVASFTISAIVLRMCSKLSSVTGWPFTPGLTTMCNGSCSSAAFAAPAALSPVPRSCNLQPVLRIIARMFDAPVPRTALYAARCFSSSVAPLKSVKGTGTLTIAGTADATGAAAAPGAAPGAVPAVVAAVLPSPGAANASPPAGGAPPPRRRNSPSLCA
mmetsp:Transcript_114176/g.295668  ORF Transcript_114176/g.295668 Transcript_114176/m.295668 type:complete len:331 (+) Transcript_114176:520-1512(+)